MQETTSRDFFRVSYFLAGTTPAVTIMRGRNGEIESRAYPRPTQASMGRLWHLVYGSCYIWGTGQIMPWISAPGWTWEWEGEEEADDEDH